MTMVLEDTKTKTKAKRGKANSDETILASFLNYTRSINPSEAAIYAVSSTDPSLPAVPVRVEETTVRGSISNYGNVFKGGVSDKAENIEKALDPENANIQRVDTASLPFDRDRFRISFSVSFRPESLTPAGCNSADVRSLISGAVADYARVGGFSVLGERYGWRLVCGGWMRRNRYAVDKKVVVNVLNEASAKSFSFDIDDVPVDMYPGSAALGKDFKELASMISDALSGKRSTLFLSVVGEGTLAPGQEIYPSQEFVGDGSGKKGAGKQKGQKSKTLSSTLVRQDGRDVRQATIHSQKIGNSLRTVDEWHGQTGEYGAVAAEPYGYVQSRSTAIRLPNRDGANGFYEILLDIQSVSKRLAAAKTVKDLTDDDHYFVAVLVRGGVFSGKDD